MSKRALQVIATFILILGTGTFAACESEESGSAEENAEGEGASSEEGATGEPADLATVDFDKHARTLSATLLNPHGSRDLALTDVAAELWGLRLEPGATPFKRLEAVCTAVVDGGCDMAPEMRYVATLRAVTGKLAEAAETQDKADAAAALKGWSKQAGAAAEAGMPIEPAVAAEPLAELEGDPVLALVQEGESLRMDVLVGPMVTRSIPDVLAEEHPDRDAFFDALESGDLFAATGMTPPDGATVEKQPGTPVRILMSANAAFGPTNALLRQLYATRKIQEVELVVRSDEYQTLTALVLNVVNTSIRGADHGVRLTADQAEWRSTEGDDESLEGVGWDGIERLGEMARAPRGQLVLYLHVADESLTNQKVADALSAIRARCGDQILCPNLQLALALKAIGE